MTHSCPKVTYSCHSLSRNDLNRYIRDIRGNISVSQQLLAPGVAATSHFIWYEGPQLGGHEDSCLWQRGGGGNPALGGSPHHAVYVVRAHSEQTADLLSLDHVLAPGLSTCVLKIFDLT